MVHFVLLYHINLKLHHSALLLLSGCLRDFIEVDKEDKVEGDCIEGFEDSSRETGGIKSRHIRSRNGFPVSPF